MSVPETIGRLRRQERLGSGGFATVWRYHDLELDSDVAVKALADNWTSRMDIRERFLEEARILRRADADHVVRVYDIGETAGGTPYFVMSYADRGTLADLLEEGQRPSVPDAVELIRQAGVGLSVLHRAGIIHRDIKPQNLLLRSRPAWEGPGPDVEVLVADLGVAKAAAHASGLTQVVGTPAYIAPEQALGTGLDVRADVHALGAVTYVLLTGQLVRDDGLSGLVDARLPAPPSTLAAVPPTLDPVLLKALEPDPDRRWPDVETFVDALVRAATGQEVPEARRADDPALTPPERTAPWRLALLSLLLLVVAFIGSYLVVDRLTG